MIIDKPSKTLSSVSDENINDDGSFNIPKGVKFIGKSAFSRCSALKTIHIPMGVKSIGENAFTRCTALHTVYMPKSVESIGKGAFSRCLVLKTIHIPKAVKAIAEGAFFGCTKLQTIHILGGVESIGESAFAQCALQIIHIPEGMKSIDNSAFIDCTALHTIYIPESLTSIHKDAFKNCAQLKKIVITSRDVIELQRIGELLVTAFGNPCTIRITGLSPLRKSARKTDDQSGFFSSNRSSKVEEAEATTPKLELSDSEQIPKQAATF